MHLGTVSPSDILLITPAVQSPVTSTKLLERLQKPDACAERGRYVPYIEYESRKAGASLLTSLWEPSRSTWTPFLL